MTVDLDAAFAAAEEAEARWAKATPGPWHAWETDADIDARGHFWFVDDAVDGTATVAEVGYGAAHGIDAAAIAAARTTEPALAATVKQFVGEVKRLRKLAKNEHGKSCAILFDAVPCSCGWHGEGEAASETLERERDAALAQVKEREALLREARDILGGVVLVTDSERTIIARIDAALAAG